MGWLSRKLEEKRLRLLAAAHRGAFESYVRHGRVPDVYWRIAAVVSEAKALNTDVSLGPVDVGRPPGGHPTNHYTWRTAGDDRVRGTHAALNGRIFSWTSPPEHGHPGSEANCRCWAEPYYGDPAVPDALLQLVPERRVNTDPGVLWASIETLTRPDGSIAASTIAMNDGTKVSSTFAGPAVTQVVTLPTLGTLIIQKEGDARGRPSSDGERRLHVAGGWRLVLPRLVPPVPAAGLTRPPELTRLPDGAGGLANAVTPAAVVARAALALYELLQNKPESLGAGVNDTPVLVQRVWQGGGGATPLLSAAVLTQAQVSQWCPRVLEAQTFIDQAAAELAHLRLAMTPSAWGTKVHVLAKELFDQAKLENPAAYANVYAEVSFDMRGQEDEKLPTVPYGTGGSTRFDLFELVNGVVCIYDYKTGDGGLTAARLARIAALSNLHFPGMPFMIMEMRQEPFLGAN
jgi:hypothetical protein